jgi:hypothetical protein
LDNLSHAEVARIKAFMSRTTDGFRPPYGMRLVESRRQCIFAGTVNHVQYARLTNRTAAFAGRGRSLRVKPRWFRVTTFLPVRQQLGAQEGGSFIGATTRSYKPALPRF